MKIRIENPDEMFSAGSSRSQFGRALGFEDVSFTPAAVADGRYRYVILNSSLDSTHRETVLVHEFHHIVYNQQNVTLYGDHENRTYQEQTLDIAVGEGSADYVQENYWREYTDRRGRSPAERMERRYVEASPSRRIPLRVVLLRSAVHRRPRRHAPGPRLDLR